MDMRGWKQVLLQWITECGFMGRNYYNIEQSDIDGFYQKFILHHKKTSTDKFKHLGNFLTEFYPGFEINFDDDNCLISADYIYVYSLLLHFCCVKYPETVFHEICQRLPDFAQQCIAVFFKELLHINPITKEALRHALAEVGNTQVTPPRLNDSFSSSRTSVSVGGLSTASFSRSESPLKTPKRCAGPQRISPSTPKSFLLQERTRELYNLRAQIETERYEKGLLELQIKQNEDEIQKLNNDHKRLLQQSQDLKNELLLKASDGFTTHEEDENQIQKRILKELSKKEQEIIKLSDNVRTLREEKMFAEKKVIYAEKEIVSCVNRIKELDFKVDELTGELKQKHDEIKYLTESKLELEQFISETRSSSSGANPDPNASADCLDSSFLRNSNTTNGSNSLSSPENLGVSVVDVQLREKAHENQLLREELRNIQHEYKRMAKHLTKLTQEFDLPLDASSSTSSEDSEQDNEQEETERDSSSEDQLSYEEQLNVFNVCMEKIDKFQKSEKNKIKQLSQESSSLQEENEDLKQNLSKLTQELKELTEKITAKEKLQQELENSKEQLQLSLEKSQHDFIGSEKEKNKLYNEVQSLQSDREKLNENIQKLKTELEMQHQESRELLANIKNLNENEQNLQTQLRELQKEYCHKTLQWEDQLKQLNNTIKKQVEEIELYRKTEKAIKLNYEQIVIKNEELKKDARQTNNHLCDIRNLLTEKENQLILLGKEIAAFKEKNDSLEENIDSLINEHKKEMLSNNRIQIELDEQIAKLKDQLTKTELLMESKQHECDLKQNRLEDLEIQLNKILKLFINHTKFDDAFDNIEEMENYFKNIMDNNEDLNSKVSQALTRVEELTQELEVKNSSLEKTQEDLLKLKAENLACARKIEELQREQVCILEKSKRDLLEKEQELRDHLSEASAEYEASIERLAVELKLEKENHNNKEMELLLSKAEHNETKKKLTEAEKEIEGLRNDIQLVQQKCQRLKQFESRVIQCSEENNKLRHEIDTFKEQVTHNALRLLEADKALAEFMELTKEQDAAKSEVEILQNKLKEKEHIIMEMELKSSIVQEENQKLCKDKERLIKDAEDKIQQIIKEQQDKLMLLTSLEKSTDQMKSITEEKQQQSIYLEQKLQDLKEEFDSLALQHTKLQGDLVEREAELRLSLDELQQGKENFQEKLNEQMKNLSEKSHKLQSIDTSLTEIIVLMENNFELNQEILEKDINNAFNYQVRESEANIQKLRKNLNHILLKQQNLNVEVKELTAQKEEALVTVATLRDNNNDLLAKLSQQEKSLKETQEKLENDELIVEKRVFQEVKRLEEDLLNLEKVNERLANENVKIQVSLGNMEDEFKDSKLNIESLDKENIQLKEDIRSKSLLVEKLQQEEKKMQHTLREKSQQIEKLSEKLKHLEVQLKDKNTKLQNLEKELLEAKEKAHKNQQKLSQCQHSNQNQQTEHKKLQEKLKLLQTSNDTLEMEVGNKNKESLVLINKNSELVQQNKDLEEQLNLTSKKLDEMVTNKLDAETKCEQLQSEVQQLLRDLEFTKLQHQTQQEDHTRLNHEINSLKVDKQHLRDEVHENKLTLQRANDNVTQLIQQISSIRLEKEAALKETVLLRKQLEETGKTQSTSETKMKFIIEKTQDFERKLLTAENELKSLKIKLEKSESCTDKLQAENKKLRDTQEVSTKRIEKLALKLGDSQAKSAKLERDNEKLGRTLEAHSATVDALQKEKDLLQSEAKTLKERLSKAERSHEQLAAKVKTLEYLNTSLQQVKQKLEASEIDGKTKLNKLEKMREANEEKIRKLTNSLNNAENVNVKLNLEIGALNSQLQEVKVEHNQEQSVQLEELSHKLTEAQELTTKFEEINEKLKAELNVVKEENSSLNDQLSKASLSLQITSQKCERYAAEMEQIRADMLMIKQEKKQIELQHETSIQKVNQFESQNTKLVYERKNLVKALEQKLAELEEVLALKTKKVIDLQKEIEVLKENADNKTSLPRTKLSQAEDVRLKEQQIISQLRLDNQILHTKYQESKQRAQEAAKLCEERIKDNRLELEGKLEKMKNKMKTLYTEEITKMKAKQEREMAVVKSELEVLKAQNTKYEEHTRKLSNQIVRLNDNILQHQKENTILSTKLKHIMDQLRQCEGTKRPSSIHVSTISSSTAAPVTAPNIRPNLAMEDEEGEVFNNTYLTDLKNGHMSEFMSRDVCVEELKYRNSLLPPHLRSTYAAQFGHELPEDELKDGGPDSLDDSMSALLSTTAGGTRKKTTGITHYKRPGPPTPSKNGGRLSFGGISEPAREILKESYDMNAGSVSSSKTPTRFNFFASRFSMGVTRDEKSNIKNDYKDFNLENVIQKPKSKETTVTCRLLAGVGCTSTPRKSKVHYDQRRCLDQLMTSSPSPSPLTVGDKIVKKERKLTPPDVSLIETPLTALDKHDAPKSSMQKNISKRIEAIAGGIRRSRRNSSMFGRRLSRRIQEICTPTSGETSSSALSTPIVVMDKPQVLVVISSSVTTSEGARTTPLLQRRVRKKSKKAKGTRPSLYSKGNVCDKIRMPNKGVLHDLNRHKSRKQRMEHFNKGRNITSFKSNDWQDEDEESDKTISCKALNNITYDWKDINYNRINHNKVLGDTVVIAKRQSDRQQSMKNTFTYVEELFEHTDTPDSDYMVEEYESVEKYEDDDEEIYGNVDQFVKCGAGVRHELVTSQDLEDFDRFIANTKNEKHIDNYSPQGDSEHFEQLLEETQSIAPFEVKHKHFDVNKSSRRTSTLSNHSHKSSYSHTHSHNKYDANNLTAATPHLSPNNPTCQLSRTIYGGTVIYNHRLPNINTTYVRKSSIYIKNRKKSSNIFLETSSCNDVVLITNQTITFVDIMRMWSQMDNSTRIIVSFAVLASFTTLLGLFVSFYSRR